MPIATRLTNTGNLLVNGSFDEVTYNSTSPVIKNLYTYTEQFNNGYWSLTNGATVVANAILSPIGTMTADKIQETSGTSFWGVATNPTALFSTTYTCSIYAKAAELNQMTISFSVVPNSTSIFTLTGVGTISPGSATTCTITSVDNGWYRCTCTFTTPSSGSNLLYNVLLTGSSTHSGTAGYGVYFWGAQLEIGSAATIYQGIAAAGTLVTPAFAERTTTNAVYATNMFDEVSDMIVTNGLLLYVNGSSDVYSGSGTTWSDLSTYNNNATLTGSPTYNIGTGGGSFAFNGSTQYAPVTAALLNTTYTGKTVFFVGRLNSAAWTPGVNQFRAMFGSASAPRNFNFYIYHDTGNSIYFHYSTTGSSFITNSVSLNTNTWFVAAVTQDATTTKVYLNGTEVYSVAGQTLSQYGNGGEEAVGKADNYWYGDIAVCAVYSRGLSAAEILNNYNAFAARVGLTPTVTASVGRNSSNGTMYVTGIFDEVTGMVVTSGMIAYIDAGKPESYPGTGTTIRDLVNPSTNTATLNGVIGWVSAGAASYWNFTTAADTAYITSLLSQNYLDCTLVFYPDLTYVAGSSSLAYTLGTGVASDRSLRFAGGNGTGPWQLRNPDSNGGWAYPAATTYYINNVAYPGAGNLPAGWNILGGLRTNTTTAPFTGNFAYTWGTGYTGRYFMGRLAAIVLYNRQLTAAEHQNNYNYFAARYGLPTVGI